MAKRQAAPQADPEIAPEINFTPTPDAEDENRLEVLLEGTDEIPQEEEVTSKIPEEYSGMSREEIFEKWEETQKVLNEKESLSSTVNRLAETIEARPDPNAQVAPQQQQQAQQPQETDAEFEERNNAEYFKTPGKAVQELVARKYGPILRDSFSKTQKLERDVLSLKPDKQEFFNKHAGEIDTTFNSLPMEVRMSGEGYQRAFNLVKSQYVEEEVSERVAAQVAAEKEKIKQELIEELQLASPKPKPRNFSETRSTTARPAARQPVVLTREQQRDAQMMHGVDPQDYAEWLQRKKARGGR